MSKRVKSKPAPALWGTDPRVDVPGAQGSTTRGLAPSDGAKPPASGAEAVAAAAGNRLEELGVIDGPVVKVLRDYMISLRRSGGHGNRKLHFDMLLSALLLGAMSGVELSLRSLEKMSVDTRLNDLWDGQKLCRATVSDNMALLDTRLLMNLMRDLARHVPGMAQADKDPDLMLLAKQILAIDGSIYRIAADVAWAIKSTRENGHKTAEVRFNGIIDVLEFVPQSAGVTGADDGAEPDAYLGLLSPNTVYVADRNFVNFNFMRRAIDAGADFVVRLKSNIRFEEAGQRALTQEDLNAGVVSDRVGRLPGSSGTPGLGDRLVREVVVKAVDRQGREQTIRLITTLLDVPAAVIGKLYRYRWKIELFFRWLKCVAGCRNLLSQDRRGVEVQFYIAMIMALLSYLRHGRRLSKHTLGALQMVARGNMTAEGYAWFIQRREREVQLEKARRERKKAAAANKA